jgi:hypothetical protein
MKDVVRRCVVGFPAVSRMKLIKRTLTQNKLHPYFACFVNLK